MFHMAAYVLTPGAGAYTFTNVPALTDGYLTVMNQHFVFPVNMKLLFASAMHSQMTDARFNAPHFREVGFPHVSPVAATQVPGLVGRATVYDPPFLTIPQLDEFAFEASVSGNASDSVIGLIGATDGNMNTPQGDIYTLKATGTITAVANVWTPGNITFESSLPSGTFAVVGMKAFGATLIAARLRFQTYQMLPGCPGLTTNILQDDWRFRMGRLGEWGRFKNTAQPSVEILCTAADTAQTFFIDMVKVGS